MELEQKLAQYFAEVSQLLFIPDPAADARFSAADRKKVLALKEQIYATSDPSVYNPLYLQALTLIKTYRERAAAVWAADVQKRFDTAKDNMSDLIKVRNHVLETSLLESPGLRAADINRDGTANMSDLIKLRNHVLGTSLISQEPK